MTLSKHLSDTERYQWFKDEGIHLLERASLDTAEARETVKILEGLFQWSEKSGTVHVDLLTNLLYLYSRTILTEVAKRGDEERALSKAFFSHKHLFTIWDANEALITFGKVSLTSRSSQVLAAKEATGEAFLTGDQAKRSSIQRGATPSVDATGAHIQSLLGFLCAKDDYSFEHSVRVSKVCRDFTLFLREIEAEELLLQDSEIQECEQVGLLHDLGKISCPDKILNKPDGLTDDEYSRLQRHPALSLALVAPLIGFSDEIGFIPILCHHLSPEQIEVILDESPFDEGRKAMARAVVSILKLADQFDAITSRRPYKPAQSIEAAITDIAGEPRSRDRALPVDLRNHFVRWLNERRPLVQEIVDSFPRVDPPQSTPREGMAN